MDTKVCTVCKEVKLLTEFHVRKAMKCNRASQCKLCVREYGQLNRAKLNERQRYWNATNRDKRNSLSRAWKSKNRKRLNEYSKQYLTEGDNYSTKLAHNSTRRANRIKATPLWANQGYIELFYKLSQIEADRIGEPVHVDHIVPLQHPLVCGLHCEDNLQLLKATDNLSKHNTFLID